MYVLKLFKNSQKGIFLIHISPSAAHGLRLLIESAWLCSSLVHGSERADFNSALQVRSALPFLKICLNHSLISYLDNSDLDYFQYSLERAMAPHSSTLAWKIPWTEEPGRLQSMGSLRVRHDWAASLSLFTFMHWRRKWQPTPVFLPGQSQGWGSLVGCRLWGHTESDTIEVTLQQQQYSLVKPFSVWNY